MNDGKFTILIFNSPQNIKRAPKCNFEWEKKLNLYKSNQIYWRKLTTIEQHFLNLLQFYYCVISSFYELSVVDKERNSIGKNWFLYIQMREFYCSPIDCGTNCLLDFEKGIWEEFFELKIALKTLLNKNWIWETSIPLSIPGNHQKNGNKTTKKL